MPTTITCFEDTGLPIGMQLSSTHASVQPAATGRRGWETHSDIYGPTPQACRGTGTTRLARIFVAGWRTGGDLRQRWNFVWHEDEDRWARESLECYVGSTPGRAAGGSRYKVVRGEVDVPITPAASSNRSGVDPQAFAGGGFHPSPVKLAHRCTEQEVALEFDTIVQVNDGRLLPHPLSTELQLGRSARTLDLFRRQYAGRLEIPPRDDGDHHTGFLRDPDGRGQKSC